MKFPLTVVTSNKPIGKQFWLEDNQVKKRTQGYITSGSVSTEHIASLEDLATVISNLKDNQVLTYGVTAHASAELMTLRDHYEAGYPAKAVTRSNRDFYWPTGPGIMMVDYDPPDNTKVVSRSELIRLVRKCIGQVDMLWMPSSSSYIYEGKKQHRGLAGQRLYILVNNVSDIPRVGKILHDKLWLEGEGYVHVSKSGAFLERSLVDGSVYQPSRIDFAGGANCAAPLCQKRKSKIFKAAFPVLDTAKVADLNNLEAAKKQQLVDVEKVRLEPDRQAARTAWIEGRICDDLRKDPSIDVESLRGDLESTLDTHSLSQHSVIHAFLSTGKATEVSVGDILDDPERYHGITCLDPLEPEYDGYRSVGVIYSHQLRPAIHSFAHGGISFKLYRRTCPAPATSQQRAMQAELVIFDEPCGSGKSQELKRQLRHVQQHIPEGSRGNLVVVPYLSEVDRFQEEVGPDWLYTPEDIDGPKLEDLQRAMIQGRNIITTHALFEKIRYFEHLLYKYDVIIDEVPQTTKKVPMFLGTVGFNDLVKDKYVTIDPKTGLMQVTAGIGKVIKKYRGGTSKDREVARFLTQVSRTDVYYVNDTCCLMPIPDSFFTKPKRVRILTFLFAGTQLQRYITAKGYKYHPECNLNELEKFKARTRKLLTFYDCNSQVATSFTAMTAPKSEARKTVGNFVVRAMKRLREEQSIPQAEVLVASFKDAWYGRELNRHSQVADATCLRKLTKLSGATYTPLITRGTNQYADKSVLLLLGTEILHPGIAKFLGMTTGEEQAQHKISEMIQLLYRTRIRRGLPVTIVIADKENEVLLRSFLDLPPID